LREAPGKFALGLGEEEVDVPGISFLETRFAVAKVIFPSSSEGIVVPKGAYLVLVFLEAQAPFAKCSGILMTEVVEGGGAKVGALDRCRNHG
jgi:hypothetical protein